MSDHDAAYVAFVSAHQARLRRIAYAVCADDDRAEDVLQEALVKLYLSWRKVREAGREEAYARRIIVNADLDDRRRPWRRRRADVDSDVLERTVLTGRPAGLDPGDRVDLVAAVRRLPVMQRRTVVLRHWLGLSVEETAAELGIREGTVKSHGARGLAALAHPAHRDVSLRLTVACPGSALLGRGATWSMSSAFAPRSAARGPRGEVRRDGSRRGTLGEDHQRRDRGDLRVPAAAGCASVSILAKVTSACCSLAAW